MKARCVAAMRLIPNTYVAKGCGNMGFKRAKKFAKTCPPNKRMFYISYSNSFQTIEIREIWKSMVIDKKIIKPGDPMGLGIDCHLCGHKILQGSETADHFHPKSRGGKLSKYNKVWAHEVCNGFKDNWIVKDLGQFRAWMDIFYVEYKSGEYTRSILFKKYRSFMVDNAIISK